MNKFECIVTICDGGYSDYVVKLRSTTRFIFALTASGYSREMRLDKLISKDMNWLGRRYGIMIGCVICTHKNVLLMGVIKLC